jgi:hypothetical protein
MERTATLGERVLDGLREAYCGIHGHDSLLQFEVDRMFLKCTSCGHESPGWDLNKAPTLNAILRTEWIPPASSQSPAHQLALAGPQR